VRRDKTGRTSRVWSRELPIDTDARRTVRPRRMSTESESYVYSRTTTTTALCQYI